MADVAGRVVIAGAGHAGGTLAALLRQNGWKGPITLIGAEPVPPYQRPPLSKAWLSGTGDFTGLLLRPAGFYAANGIELSVSAEVASIDRRDRMVRLSSGRRVAYDQLVLAVGSYARSLPVPGHDLPGIIRLRTLADAERLKAVMCPGVRIAIVGAGYIGLEVAASARMRGVAVVVLERESRVLPRVVSAPTSDFFQRRHAAFGVQIILNTAVAAFEDNGGRVAMIRLSDGSAIPCDAALIGVGVASNDALARAAGLDCAGGVIVDAAARTSDPAIRAIGDCARHPLPLYHRSERLESVPNALEQARLVAADLCGRPLPAPEVPWFWSDQYDDRLQIAGLPFDVARTVIRGDPPSASFAVFHLTEDGMVQAVEAVNAPAEFMAGRIMIARRQRTLATSLRDASRSLHALTR